MELKKRPSSFNFFLIDDITEKSYSSLKEEVFKEISEIKKIDEENEQCARSLGIDIECLKTPVKFNFHISTYGGCVYHGLALFDMLRKLDEDDNGIDVTIICEGKIMSMGIPLILSVRNRVCTPLTTFMIHQVGGWSAGKLTDIKEDNEERERLWNICKRIIVENSKITMDLLDEWDKCRANMYFDAGKALEYGLIKAII